MLIWLSATLTLESGLVKLASGDAAWRDLSALTFHWWTQPLPTWSSVLLAQLPLFTQQVLCAAMFVFELLVPMLAFGPRRARLWSPACRWPPTRAPRGDREEIWRRVCRRSTLG